MKKSIDAAQFELIAGEFLAVTIANPNVTTGRMAAVRAMYRAAGFGDPVLFAGNRGRCEMVAIVQYGYGILGIGRTTRGALIDANRQIGLGDPRLRESDLEAGKCRVVGSYCALPCTDRLVVAVREGGGASEHEVRWQDGKVVVDLPEEV